MLWRTEREAAAGKVELPMQTIPILLTGLLVVLAGLITWGVWALARAGSEEGRHQDVLLGLLLFAVFGLGVWVTFLLVSLVR
jgi:high-affinity Fe2+/Pb2+ permease